MKLKVIAFDADDTLWINETYLMKPSKILWFDGDYLSHQVSKII
jgi:putative hydrolase of the HAD superfamily